MPQDVTMEDPEVRVNSAPNGSVNSVTVEVGPSNGRLCLDIQVSGVSQRGASKLTRVFNEEYGDSDGRGLYNKIEDGLTAGEIGEIGGSLMVEATMNGVPALVTGMSVRECR